jgi:hypothetical protein
VGRFGIELIWLAQKFVGFFLFFLQMTYPSILHIVGEEERKQRERKNKYIFQMKKKILKPSHN